MQRNLSFFLLFSLLLSTTGALNAQDIRWYFGSSPTWMRWNDALNLQLESDQQTPFGSAGAAVATDPETGELFFYTDGLRLYDSNNTLVSNSLGGDVSKTNPVMLVPVAGQPEQYYIFVNTPDHSLQYYTYNYVTGNLGGANTVGGLTDVADALTLVRQADQFGYWIVVPVRGTAQFRLVSVDAGGVNASPAIDLSASMPAINAYSMSYNQDNTLLAVGGSEGDDAAVYLLQVDTRAGQPAASRLSFRDTLEAVNSQNGNISGLAWSNNYLFVAKEQNAVGTDGAIWRADISTVLTTPDTVAYLPREIAVRPRMFDLKLGPDGFIYNLYQDGSGQQLARITSPGRSNPQYETALLNGNSFAGTHFPQVAPPPFEELPATSLDIVGTCFDNPTYFYPKFEDKAPDSIRWDFGDDSEGRGLQVRHTYSQGMAGGPSTYTVELTAFFPGNTQTIQKTINLTTAPEMQLQPEIVICPEADSVLKPTIQDPTTGEDALAQYTITWLRPVSSEKTLDADESVKEEADSITVQAISFTEPDGSITYPEAGVYYVIATPNDGTGCTLSATTRVVVYETESQKVNSWYFGDGAGINFNVQPPEAVFENQMRGADQAPEGTALEADLNGDILVYTNGEGLWFGRDETGTDTHIKAPNGDDIGGSVGATQSSLIVPFGSDATLFYVFTTDEEGNFSYTVADLKDLDVEVADDVPGEFIRDRLLRNDATEKLTAVTGDDIGTWVVIHQLNTNQFLSIPIDTTGIGNPVYSRAGEVVSNAASTGYMRFSEDGEYLAIAIPEAGNNIIQLFRYNTETGEVENDFVTIPLDGASGELYGLEIAENRLYASTTSAFGGGNSQLYQFTIDSAFNEQRILDSQVLIDESADAWGALQLAPNGQLYMAVDGANSLAVFINPTDTANASASDRLRFSPDEDPLTPDLSPNRSLLGLPNFIAQTGTSIPDATVAAEGACEGEDVIVSGQSRYSNETFVFEILDASGNPLSPRAVIGEPGGIETPDTLFSFADFPQLVAGSYLIDMKLISECGIYPDPAEGEDPVRSAFEIFGIPEAGVEGDPSKALCEAQSVTFNGQALLNGTAQDPAGYTFVWLDALSGEQFAAGPQLTVEEPGAWQLIVFNSTSGCESEPLNVEVLEQRPDAELGDDIELCVGGSLPVNQLSIDLTNPADFLISWRLAENSTDFQELNNDGTSQDLSAVSTDQPGIYRYLVEVRSADQSQPCFRADTLTIAVNLPPAVTLRPTGNTCSGTTTLVAEVENIDPNGLQYEFFGPNGSLGITSSPSITVNQSGTYSVQLVPDDAASCASQSAEITIDVFNGLSDIRLEAEPGCGEQGEIVQNTITLYSSYAGELVIQLVDLEINVPEKPMTVTAPYTFDPRPDGEYKVIAWAADNTGCTDTVESEVIDVRSTVVPAGALNDLYTVCPDIPELSSVTISLPGFQRYQWTNASTGQVISTAEEFTVSQEGSYELLLEECNIPVPFEVTFDCSPRLFLPNAIRVNGQNPVFKILNANLLSSIDNFQLLIFNRWGEAIYQTNDPAFEWFGENHQGDLVMTGTYPYVITYRNLYGESQEMQQQRGGITVLH